MTFLLGSYLSLYLDSHIELRLDLFMSRESNGLQAKLVHFDGCIFGSSVYSKVGPCSLSNYALEL